MAVIVWGDTSILCVGIVGFRDVVGNSTCPTLEARMVSGAIVFHNFGLAIGGMKLRGSVFVVLRWGVELNSARAAIASDNL